MRVAIVGAGPAGLFLAKLFRLQSTSIDVDVFEQNAADATYGFGVGLLGSSLNFLKDADEDVYNDILKVAAPGNTMMVAHRGECVTVQTEESVGIERIRLLRLLQEHCDRLGVNMAFSRRVENIDALKNNYDLLVGADGVNSIVRKTYIDRFQSKISPQRMP